jgi:DNA invertase Pin-like site-specific DNA recombinase
MKKEVQYKRVSTGAQSMERQETIIFGALVMEEAISGSVEFGKRSKGMAILKMAEAGELGTLHVHSIDRLGRNTLDILNTIQYLTSKGVNVKSTKEGFETMIEGKENPIAKMMIGILATLSEFELSRIKERQSEGIAKAKERGVYKTNGGNKKPETISQFLAKKSTKKIIKYYIQGNSLRATAKLSEMSLSTVQKAVDLYERSREEASKD